MLLVTVLLAVQWEDINSKLKLNWEDSAIMWCKISRIAISNCKGKIVVKKSLVFLWSLQTDIHTQIAGKIIF